MSLNHISFSVFKSPHVHLEALKHINKCVLLFKTVQNNVIDWRQSKKGLLCVCTGVANPSPKVPFSLFSNCPCPTHFLLPEFSESEVVREEMGGKQYTVVLEDQDQPQLTHSFIYVTSDIREVLTGSPLWTIRYTSQNSHCFYRKH